MAYFPAQNNNNSYTHFTPYYTQSQPVPFYAHNQLYPHDSIAANAAESAAIQVQALEKAKNLAQYVVPQTASAIFSTNNGKLTKRVLQEPFPPPVLRTQDRSAVTEKADQLRERFPTLMPMVKPVKNKEDLWSYFDSIELWTQGITFLIDVVNEINRKNKIDDAKAKLIDEEAIYWVRSQESQIWDAHKRNPNDTSSFFKAVEEAGMYDDCLPEERDLIRRALSFYRDLCLRRRQEQEQHQAQREVRNQPFQETQILSATVDSSAAPNLHGESILHLIQPSVNVKSSQSTIQPTSVANRPNIYGDVPSSGFPNPAIRVYNNNGASSRTNTLGSRDAQTLGIANGVFSSRSVVGLQNNRVRVGGPGRAEFTGSNFLQGGNRIRNGAPGPQARADSSDMAPSISQPIYMLTPRKLRDQPQPDMPTHHVDASQRSRSEPNPVRVVSSFDGAASTIPQHQNMSTESCPHSFASVIQIFTDNERAQVNFEKQTVTLCYNEPTLQNKQQHQSSRAVYVYGIEKALFVDDRLKKMMSLCGEVEKIHYMHSKQPGSFGTVFVTFTDEASPRRAIQKFDGHPLASGQILHVNYPKSKFIHTNDHSNYRRSSIHARASSEYSTLFSTPNIRRDDHSSQHDYSSILQPHDAQGFQSCSRDYVKTDDQLTVGFQSQLASVTGWPRQTHGSSASMSNAVGSLPGSFVSAALSEALKRRSAIERFTQQQSLGVNTRNALSNMRVSSHLGINCVEMRRHAQRGPSSTGRGSHVKATKQQHRRNDQRENSSLGLIANASTASSAPSSNLLDGIQRIAAKKKDDGESKRGTLHKPACNVPALTPTTDKGKSKAQVSDFTVTRSPYEVMKANLKAFCVSNGSNSQMDNFHSAPIAASSKYIQSLPRKDNPGVLLEHKESYEAKVKKKYSKNKRAQNLYSVESIAANLPAAQAPARRRASYARSKPNATSLRSSNTDSRFTVEVSTSSKAMEFTESSTSRSSESSSGRGSDMTHNLSQASDTTNTTLGHAETLQYNSSDAQNKSLVPSATKSKNSSIETNKLPKLAADMKRSAFTGQQSRDVVGKGKSVIAATISSSDGSSEEQTPKFPAKLDDRFEFPDLKPLLSPPSMAARGKVSLTPVLQQAFDKHSSVRRNVVPARPSARKRL